MTETFFGRIALHGTTAAKDPREDRLTEVLAAVFGSAAGRGLARHLAHRWLTSGDLETEAGLLANWITDSFGALAEITATPQPPTTEAIDRLRTMLGDRNA